MEGRLGWKTKVRTLEHMTDTPATTTQAPAAETVPAPVSIYVPGDWYVVSTYVGHEQKVKANLEMRVRTMRAEDRIHEVVIPTEEVVEYSGGQKKTKTRNTFPGYVLVRAEMDDDVWHIIRETPGATGFVGADGQRPAPLTRREVAHFLGQETEDGESPRRVEKPQWQPGDLVRITTGPFADMGGSVADIDADSGKLTVLVDIFGRDTPVELGVGEVTAA